MAWFTPIKYLAQSAYGRGAYDEGSYNENAAEPSDSSPDYTSTSPGQSSQPAEHNIQTFDTASNNLWTGVSAASLLLLVLAVVLITKASRRKSSN